MSSRIGEFGRGEGGAGPKKISGFEISSGWHLWFPCCLTAGTYSSEHPEFLAVVLRYCFSYPVKFLPSFSPTLLTSHYCCVDVLSVHSCLKLNRHNT